LLSDEDQPDRKIVAALHTSGPTVQRTWRQFVEGGLEQALNEDPRPGGRRKLDAQGQAVLHMLAQSAPPEDRQRWTLQLLADRLVALKVMDNISYETVCQALTKATEAMDEEAIGNSRGGH